MGRRAFGANAVMAFAFNSTGVYGAIPAAGGYTKMPFGSSNLGEEQQLTDPGVLGLGRNPQAPEEGPVDNDGDVSVHIDVRFFGYWLKLLFGAPTTTQGVAATGLYTFSAQPAVDATITVGGQAFTFKAANPGANQILIGATLAETIRNAVWALNASVVAGVMAASYSTDRTYSTIKITHDTIGVGGNAMTIAAGGTSNATVSGATLSGGSAVGPYNHVFVSGAQVLPDAAIEIGNPEVPAFGTNYGAMANTLAIAMQRSGSLRAAINLICQGETDLVDASTAGALAEMVLELFAQATGEITDSGVPLAEVVSANFNFSNNLEKAENVRGDGRIDGADGAVCSITPSFTVRFKDRGLDQRAALKQVVDASIGWSKGAGKSLTFRMPSVRLPKTKRGVTGPAGVQRTFNCLAYQALGQQALIVTLVNDVAAY
jgi:hypothetical protein